VRFFDLHGQHAALMGVIFGMEESTPPCQISPPFVQGWGNAPKRKIYQILPHKSVAPPHLCMILRKFLGIAGTRKSNVTPIYKG